MNHVAELNTALLKRDLRIDGYRAAFNDPHSLIDLKDCSGLGRIIEAIRNFSKSIFPVKPWNID